jgi:hypothetical protein
MTMKQLFLSVWKVAICMLVVAVPWLLLVPPVELGDENWGKQMSVGIAMASAFIWLPFIYRHRDHPNLLAALWPGQEKYSPPPRRGASFKWIVMGSIVVSTLATFRRKIRLSSIFRLEP